MAKPLSFDEFVKLKLAQDSKADKLDQLIQDESVKLQNLPEQDAIKQADYLNNEVIPLRHRVKEEEKQNLLNLALQTPGSDESSLPIQQPVRQLNEMPKEEQQAPIQPESEPLPNIEPSPVAPNVPAQIEQPAVAPSQPPIPVAPQSNFPPEEQLISNGYNNASLDNLKDVQSQQNLSNLFGNLSKVGETLGSRFTGTPESNVSSNIFKQNAEDVGSQYVQQIEMQKKDPESAVSKTYKDYFKSLTGRDLNPNASAYDIEKILPYGVREQLQKQEAQKAFDLAKIKGEAQKDSASIKEKQKEEDRKLQGMKEDRRDERLQKTLDNSLAKTQKIEETKKEKASKLDASQVKDITAFDNAISAIKSIREKKPTQNTGPLSKIQSDVAQTLGIDDPEKSAFRAEVQNQLAEYIRSISGAGVSNQERAFLIKNIPNMSDNDATFNKKLDSLEQKIDTNKNNFLQNVGKVGKNVEDFKKSPVVASSNISDNMDEEAKSRARQARIAELKAKQGK